MGRVTRLEIENYLKRGKLDESQLGQWILLMICMFSSTGKRIGKHLWWRLRWQSPEDDLLEIGFYPFFRSLHSTWNRDYESNRWSESTRHISTVFSCTCNYFPIYQYLAHSPDRHAYLKASLSSKRCSPFLESCFILINREKESLRSSPYN